MHDQNKRALEYIRRAKNLKKQKGEEKMRGEETTIKHHTFATSRKPLQVSSKLT